jgi:hypothetical protein
MISLLRLIFLVKVSSIGRDGGFGGVLIEAQGIMFSSIRLCWLEEGEHRIAPV